MSAGCVVDSCCVDDVYFGVEKESMEEDDESIFVENNQDDDDDAGGSASVVWKEILAENDLLEGLEDDSQFVDFVLLEGSSVLDLISAEDDGIDSRAADTLLLCNGEKRQTTEETPIGRQQGSVTGGKDEARNNVRKTATLTATKANDAAAYKCSVCLMRFKIKAHLIRHMLWKHRRQDIHRDEKIYSRCLRCNELFKSTVELENHLREKHKSTLACDICLRLFDNRKSLNRHRQFHEGVNPFTCDVCNKQCKNSSHLHFHRRTHFTKDSGYRCQHCDRKFSSSGNCQKHIARVHTLEKRHHCPSCLEAFVYPRQLKIHLAKDHPSQALGQHDCRDCNTKFASKQALVKHQRSAVHYQQDRPHRCDQCSSRFKQLGHLKTHLLTHSGEKPFGCDQCDKRFRTRNDLRIHHKGKHSNERPFSCDLCDKTFVVAYQLNQHRIKAHGG